MQRDPTDVAVQISFRCPFWYREQLIREADNARTSVPHLVLDAIERMYPPKQPAS